MSAERDTDQRGDSKRAVLACESESESETLGKEPRWEGGREGSGGRDGARPRRTGSRRTHDSGPCACCGGYSSVFSLS